MTLSKMPLHVFTLQALWCWYTPMEVLNQTKYVTEDPEVSICEIEPEYFEDYEMPI